MTQTESQAAIDVTRGQNDGARDLRQTRRRQAILFLQPLCTAVRRAGFVQRNSHD